MAESFQMPRHGQVEDIGGSGMVRDIKQRLMDIFARPYDKQNKPTLPDELLYDDIGLPIWNKIIWTDEFYQTHDEIAIFDNNGAEIAARVQPDVTMIDLGAGDTRKVGHLLAAFENIGKTATYLALDISKSSLVYNINFLKKRHSNPNSVVRCAGIWGTFEDGLRYAQRIQGPRLFLSLGSVLCNDPWPDALKRVKEWAGILRPDDFLLVGMDGHLKSTNEEKIWAAYHSCDDLYESFFQNGFNHANRLMGETWFRKGDWELRAELEEPTRHRFYFKAKRSIRLGRTAREILEGEEIDWFDSHKYGQADVETMFAKAGLIAVSIWQAPDSEFRQYLVKLKDDSDQGGDADSAVSGVN